MVITLLVNAISGWTIMWSSLMTLALCTAWTARSQSTALSMRNVAQNNRIAIRSTAQVLDHLPEEGQAIAHHHCLADFATVLMLLKPLGVFSW